MSFDDGGNLTDHVSAPWADSIAGPMERIRQSDPREVKHPLICFAHAYRREYNEQNRRRDVLFGDPVHALHQELAIV
jgi:hypothetical protein